MATTLSSRETIVARYTSRTASSLAAFERARKTLSGGVSRSILYHRPDPTFVRRAEGAYVEDLDGNRYLDAIGNYTSMILGHGDGDVASAIREQIDHGMSVAGPSLLEAELAELLCDRVASMDQVRFTVSGTEATMMAIRAARAFTGRSQIAKFEGGYHGMHDYAMVSVAPPLDQSGPPDSPRPVAPLGIPPEVRDTVTVLPFNDLDAVRQIVGREAERLAGILVEPVMGVAGVIGPAPGFLELLRDLADEHGFVLIFDEVMSFRLAHGGAQELFGVTPDLTTLAKVIGGGFPVAAIGGRRDIMALFDPTDGPTVLLSGTWHAGLLSLRAAVETVRRLTPEAIAGLNERGTRLRRRLEDLIAPDAGIALTSVGSLLAVHASAEPISDYRASARGDRDIIGLLHLALLNEGVMIAPRGMICLSLAMGDADIDLLVDAFGTAMRAVVGP